MSRDSPVYSPFDSAPLTRVPKLDFRFSSIHSVQNSWYILEMISIGFSHEVLLHNTAIRACTGRPTEAWWWYQSKSDGTLALGARSAVTILNAP